MDDLISRQAAIDEIGYELEMIDSALDSITLDFNTRERLRQRRGEAREILNSIQQLPSAQPKRGKWIKTARWGRVYYCDQCRNYLDFDGVNAGRGSTNFCPNCGADMRQKGENSESN